MRTELIDTLVQQAIKTIERTTDYVDYLEFSPNNSLYMYCRMRLNRPSKPGEIPYEDVTLTAPDPSLSHEEKVAIYKTVLAYVQKKP